MGQGISENVVWRYGERANLFWGFRLNFFEEKYPTEISDILCNLFI